MEDKIRELQKESRILLSEIVRLRLETADNTEEGGFKLSILQAKYSQLQFEIETLRARKLKYMELLYGSRRTI